MDLLDPITAKDEPDFQQVETTTMAQMQIMIIDPSPYSFDGVRFINITNREAENAGGFVPLSPCLVHIYVEVLRVILVCYYMLSAVLFTSPLIATRTF